jgi:hypothetical protein
MRLDGGGRAGKGWYSGRVVSFVVHIVYTCGTCSSRDEDTGVASFVSHMWKMSLHP